VSTGNLPEQVEAGLVEAIIEALRQKHGAEEISRTYSIDADDSLMIDSTLVVMKPANSIKVDLKIL
jgi:hypothetical protein